MVEAPWTGSDTPSKISDPQQSVGDANGCLIVGDRLKPDSKPNFPDSVLNFPDATSGATTEGNDSTRYMAWVK